MVSTQSRRWQSARSGARAHPDFRLNFIPVAVSGEAFAAGTLPFESREQLLSLRAEYTDTHLFVRRGDTIVDVPLVGGIAPIGEEHTRRARDDAGIVRRLLDTALLRFLSARGYLFTDLHPPTFVARAHSRDLLAQAIGATDGSLIDWLHVYPEYRLSARTIHAHSRPAITGVQVGFWTHREIDATVAQLLERGLDVSGRYVRSLDPDEPVPDSRRDLQAMPRLAGRVRAVADGWLYLDDARDTDRVRADDAWLESRIENFDACLRASGVTDVAGTIQRLKRLSFERITGAKARLERLEEIAALLRQQGDLLLAPNLTCRIEAPLVPTTGREAGSYRRYPKPSFVFDPARTKTSGWHDKGLEDFGPFDSESFTPKRPHFAVVTPREYQGDVEVFLRQFKDGVPAPRSQERFYSFEKGFIRKYHLNDCTYHFESFDPAPREAVAYRDACLRSASGQPKPDLAFVVIEDRHAALHGDDNPYLIAKSVFMAQGIPVQEVTIETIRGEPGGSQSGLRYTLNNIGLASYAKLGGIPFVMAAAPGLAHELVIGIGSADVSEGRLSGRERVVGITTVFSADGNYLLYNTSREVDFDEYPAELLSTLGTAIRHVRVRNAWQPGDSVRLVFHVFKPLKDAEAVAVKQLVEELIGEFQVEFAFVHVSEDHDWMLFDRNSEGVQDFQVPDRALRGQVKGECVPDRGYAIPLGRSDLLLSVTGPRDLKTPLQGTPKPLLLHLHRESTFTDLEYLGGQLFRFTALSWRSFFPSNRPVTILYSDLIARLLGELRDVKNWNPDMLVTALRGSRWFL